MSLEGLMDNADPIIRWRTGSELLSDQDWTWWLANVGLSPLDTGPIQFVRCATR